MKPKSIITITLLCFLVLQLNAQKNDRTAKFNLGVGISVHSILDEGYAPFTFNSANPSFNFSFIRDKDNNRIAAGLNTSIGKTNYMDYNLFETNLIDVNLFALYARKIEFNIKNSSLHIGTMVDYRILFLLNMRDEFTVGNVSYTAATSFGLYTSYDYKINDKNNLRFNIKYPLISNVVRNPYTGFNQATTLLTDFGENLVPLIFHDPKLVHGFKFIRPSLELEWEKQLSSKFILVPKVEIEYLNYNAINPIEYFKTNFSIALNF